MSETFSTTHVLEYPYTRTTGPVVGPFLTALRDGKLLGSRIGDKVYCPPLEFDPSTFETAEPDLVEVGPGGQVVTATWISDPSSKHPLSDPFAFALILLDGADTPMVHAVQASGADEVTPGTRVAAQYRDERVGAITDVFFVPEGQAVDQAIEPSDEDPVAITEHLISLKVQEPLYPHRARFVQGLLDGKIIAQRSPASGQVYVPGRGYDNIERVRMTEADDVEVADVGTVVGFTQLTPVQYHGQLETEPYIRCSLLLDGTDQPVTGIDVRDISIDEFRVGMRLRAVWNPPDERDVSDIDNRYGNIPETVIGRWEHTGEPDVPFEEIKHHNW